MFCRDICGLDKRKEIVPTKAQGNKESLNNFVGKGVVQ
jgi:hypothetical protein